MTNSTQAKGLLTAAHVLRFTNKITIHPLDVQKSGTTYVCYNHRGYEVKRMKATVTAHNKSLLKLQGEQAEHLAKKVDDSGAAQATAAAITARHKEDIEHGLAESKRKSNILSLALTARDAAVKGDNIDCSLRVTLCTGPAGSSVSGNWFHTCNRGQVPGPLAPAAAPRQRAQVTARHAAALFGGAGPSQVHNIPINEQTRKRVIPPPFPPPFR